MFHTSTRILLVDDMPTVRKLVLKVIQDLGFTQIEESSNGGLAWETIQNANPPIGIVISDLSMPHSSGVDLIKRIRSEARFKSLPVLIMYAEFEKKEAELALKAGASELIVKPFQQEQLKEKLTAMHTKFSS